MKKTAVVYWSGTGNTEAMAKAVAEGMESAGAQVTMLTPDQVKASELSAYDAIAFGCPAMGSEVLEEMEFQPMFDEVKRSLGGKSAALFGSYGWGDGEWMRGWEKDCDDCHRRMPAFLKTRCDGRPRTGSARPSDFYMRCQNGRFLLISISITYRYVDYYQKTDK